MNQTGLYEQLITQLVEQNLDRESFHVGERLLEAGEAATWLSRFLTRLIEVAMESVLNGESRIHEQINLANTIVKWLSKHIKDDELISENLLDSQGKILTALFDKTNPIAADLPKFNKPSLKRRSPNDKKCHIEDISFNVVNLFHIRFWALLRFDAN